MFHDTIIGKDTCQGDSGGGLYIMDQINGKNKYVTSGVVSNGYGCAQVGWPGLYTRVSYYLDWIEKNSQINNNDSDRNSSIKSFNISTINIFSILVINLLIKYL